MDAWESILINFYLDCTSMYIKNLQEFVGKINERLQQSIK